jgi:myo-inositol-1(or 4)-monophosphatase
MVYHSIQPKTLSIQRDGGYNEAVRIEDLRAIGRQLFQDIGRTRLTTATAEALEKGAGGDRTFAVDKQAEDIILCGLEALNEPMSIVSEEFGSKNLLGGGQRVLIDPIDGSKNAVSGLPFYCAAIAVAEGDTVGDIVQGYVVNLLSGDEFWAVKGQGAYFNGRRMTAQQDDLLRVVAFEAQQPPRDMKHLLPLLSAARRVRCLGAVALDLAYVAYSAISVFYTNAPSRSIDFGAGALFVRESGGLVTDSAGESIDNSPLGLSRSVNLLASGNSRLHEMALSIIGARQSREGQDPEVRTWVK